MTVDALSSIPTINKTDAKRLLNTYGCVKDIVGVKDYDEFLDIEGIGQRKVDILSIAFKGHFKP